MARQRDEEQDIDQDESEQPMTVSDLVEELEELSEVKALPATKSTNNALRAIAKYILSRSAENQDDESGEKDDSEEKHNSEEKHKHHRKGEDEDK